MIKHLFAAAILLTLSGGVFAAGATSGDAGPSDKSASGAQTDAIKLCDRLAGVERDLCIRQAREARGTTDKGGTGATPGSGGSSTGGGTAPPSGTGAGTTGGGTGSRY